MTLITRSLTIIGGLMLWFHSQAFLASYLTGYGNHDTIHIALTTLNDYAKNTPLFAEFLLASSGLIVDIAAISLVTLYIFGQLSTRTIMALFGIFVFRQLCQVLVALPAPDGMIWFTPNMPSVLVTYETGADFFFSGHTAITAFFTFVMWSRTTDRLKRLLNIYLIVQLIWQITCIMILRSHWTQDVITALLVAWIAATA